VCDHLCWCYRVNPKEGREAKATEYREDDGCRHKGAVHPVSRPIWLLTGVSIKADRVLKIMMRCPIQLGDCILFCHAFSGGQNADLARARRHMNW
jgi:hypothetical protein